jgi:hypothetical protein
MVLVSHITHNPIVGLILSQGNSGFGFENQSQFVFWFLVTQIGTNN